MNEAPTIVPQRFYERESPAVGEIVMAEVLTVGDKAIDCALLAYERAPAMLPTSELSIRRGQRIADIVHVGLKVPLCVIRVEGTVVDLSMRQCRADEREVATKQYAEDSRIVRLMRSAAKLDPARTAELMRTVVWPLQAEGVSVSALVEETRLQLEDGAPTHPTLPADVLATIRTTIPLNEHSAEREITLRFGIYPDGAQRLQAALRALATQEGIEVYVVAAPKFRVVARDRTPTRAAARLETVLATCPAPC